MHFVLGSDKRYIFEGRMSRSEGESVGWRYDQRDARKSQTSLGFGYLTGRERKGY